MRSSSSHMKRAMSVADGDSHDGESPLHNFVKAKKKINETFGEIKALLEECNGYLADCSVSNENETEMKKFASEVAGFLTQASSIAEVLARDQMKVAFFGRTSNGKSTTINAMLHDRILPSGIGHTTNCFLSLHGGDAPEPYVLMPDSEERKSVKNLQIAHALNDERLDHSSLVKIFWPKTRCEMLSEDVVLVDSPGIDVTPDLDSWIDQHCLDADVFVLVVNAESTLMVTEKNFFHKVNERLSRPNIFILNNRWDASVGELETMDLVKQQHLERNISFLVDELQCVSQSQAKDRVFFVSAKETLMSRMQKLKGMPKEGGAIHVEGFHARQLEFDSFEHKFQECISSSAIKTKFESHAVSGRRVVSSVKAMMETIERNAYQERIRLENEKKKHEDKLERVKEQLDLFKHDCKNKILDISSQVERKVAAAMSEEIDRLGVLVNEFDYPFHPHTGFIRTYKKELHQHIERGLSRNLVARCSSSQVQVITQAHEEMAERLKDILPSESPEQPLMTVNPSREFEVYYKLDTQNLCADFHEDIEFHFSLGWHAVVRKFLAPHHAGLAAALGANIQRNVQGLIPRQTPVIGQADNDQEPRRTEPEPPPPYGGDEAAVALIHGIATLTSRTSTAVVIAGGLVWRLVGWKFIAFCGGLYGGIYVIERLRWTNNAREKAFKRQFVDYAVGKLQQVVSYTSYNSSVQVQQELSTTYTRLESLVTQAKETLEDEILEFAGEITRLEGVEHRTKTLKNKAQWFDRELHDFIKAFGLNKSKI